MSSGDQVFTGSIPELYDTYLVPLIFEAYATDLAERAAALAPKTILETAAGSGVVTRALAFRLASDACYAVTDLNQPMLDHAADKQGPDNRITWRQADALDLPFDDAAFDIVICQFGVMFFPDRIAGYVEARRVLKPGGLPLQRLGSYRRERVRRCRDRGGGLYISQRPAAISSPYAARLP